MFLKLTVIIISSSRSVPFGGDIMVRTSRGESSLLHMIETRLFVGGGDTRYSPDTVLSNIKNPTQFRKKHILLPDICPSSFIFIRTKHGSQVG